MAKRKIKPDSNVLTKADSTLASLPPKRASFVRHYCGLVNEPDMRARWNASEAARRAGYSEEAARAIGFDLLQDGAVKLAIAEVQAQLREQHAALARKAIEETVALATSRITDVVEIRNGRLHVLEDIPDYAVAAIAEISEKASPSGEITLKVKMHSKPAALSTLLKAIGYMNEIHQTTVNVGVRVDGRGVDEGLSDQQIQRIREALGIRAELEDRGLDS